jgi:hypothetical protein
MPEIEAGGICLDPERFQSRDASIKDAFESDLSDVSGYNVDFAGVLSVWLDPGDGAVYLVDGHRRLELAQRTATKLVFVQFLNYDSASEVLVAGALINVAKWINYPTRRLHAICCRLRRIEAVLTGGEIPRSSRIWQQVWDTIPELAEVVLDCCPSIQRRQLR